MNGLILDENNDFITLTSFKVDGAPENKAVSILPGIPLGTLDGTTTGEVAVKVKVVGTNSLPVESQGLAVYANGYVATTSGSTSNYLRSATFIASDDFEGFIEGDFPLYPSESITITANFNDVLDSIDYTITAGSLRIMQVIID